MKMEAVFTYANDCKSLMNQDGVFSYKASRPIGTTMTVSFGKRDKIMPFMRGVF
jgi:hypothetical protein